MKVYTYSRARNRLASVLDEAKEEGEVRIRRRNGDEFVIRPVQTFDFASMPTVEGADVTAEEIVDVIREGRARGYSS